MKFVFLCGGFAGFTIAVVSGYYAGSSPDRILLNGAVGALTGGLLMKWLWSVVLNGLREVFVARQRAAEAAAAAGTPAPRGKL